MFLNSVTQINIKFPNIDKIYFILFFIEQYIDF